MSVHRSEFRTVVTDGILEMSRNTDAAGDNGDYIASELDGRIAPLLEGRFDRLPVANIDRLIETERDGRFRVAAGEGRRFWVGSIEQYRFDETGIEPRRRTGRVSAHTVKQCAE